MRYILWVFFLFLLLVSLGEAAPRHVILFIGDGLSQEQIKIFESLAHEEGKTTVFSRFPVHVSLENRTREGTIPDSASAATSIACGVKVPQGVVAQDAEGRSLKSIAQKLKERGWKVGIVTNVALNDATPAVFYAHAASRRNYDQIAWQLPKSGFDLFVGSGIATSQKTTRETILEFARKQGYRVMTKPSDFLALPPSSPTIALLPFTFAIDQKDNALSLASATKKAIEFLADSEEFFLLVEGGRIDWCNHTNDAASSLIELEDLEGAIVEALQFFKNHPEETLIIVTADHGTGGMQRNPKRPLRKPFQTSSYERFLHTLQAIPRDEKALLELCSLTWGKPPSFFAEDKVYCQILRDFLAGKDEKALWIRLAHRASSEWGITWTTTGHTGEPVPLFAWGVKAELFSKAQKNTDIAPILEGLLEENVALEKCF